MVSLKTNRTEASISGKRTLGLLWMGCSLCIALGVLFFRSFRPELVVFSNDGPLGANHAAFFSLPSAFFGIWQDLTWVGSWAGSALPTITYMILWLLGPVGFAKFYAPLCLLVLGLSAWMFFRQSGFRPAV